SRSRTPRRHGRGALRSQPGGFSMQSKAKTVAEYIAALPEDRRDAIKAVRAVIKKHLPAGYKEGMDYGYIGWAVPPSAHPPPHPAPNNGPPPCYAAPASQKNHRALYLMCAYADGPVKQRLVAGFKAAGKKLDMGKACIRFKQLDDLPLDVIAQAAGAVPMKKYIEVAKAAHAKKKGRHRRRSAMRRASCSCAGTAARWRRSGCAAATPCHRSRASWRSRVARWMQATPTSPWRL